MAQVPSDSLKFALIVAATFYLSCEAAPLEPWWYRPCEYEIPRLRHGRSAHDKKDIVPNLLDISVKTFRGINGANGKLQKLYNHTFTHDSSIKLRGLKISAMLKKMQKAKNQVKELQAFDRALQYFAGTTEKLRKLQINTNALHFDYPMREGIYNESAIHIRNLLCEIEDILIEKKRKVPKRISLKQIKIRIAKKVNFTSAYNLDKIFFNKTYDFFLRTRRILTQSQKKSKSKKSAVQPKRT